MRRMMTILVMVICLIPFSRTAFAEEKQFEGEISVAGKYIGVDAKEGGEAKFTEYKDLKENGGLHGRVHLDYDREKYFLNFRASDIAYDTQKFELEGGLWGKFKYDLYYQDIPHNITFDARTPFVGAGSDVLTGNASVPFATWDTFDYSIERRQYGGGLQLNLIKPFFFDTSFQREEREGIKPTGASVTSTSGIAVELPEPVDYLTNNLKIETGYAKNPLFLSLSYFYSDFNNSNSRIDLNGITSPVFNTPRTFSLPPDNTYNRWGFKGAVKLPFNSRFNTNLGLARGKSDTSIFPTYDGKVKTENYDFVLTSNPIRFLDTKVFYKHYKRDNESEDPSGTATHFLDHQLNNYGVDVGFRLPARLYLSGGYQFVKTKREFSENPNDVLPFNKDNLYSAGLKWSGLDFMDVTVSYEKLDRDEKFRSPQTAADLSRMYAYASQDRDTFKSSVDIFPLENFNFGFEYRHRKSEYTETVFGLKSDKRDEFGSNAAYTLGNLAKLFGNVDVGLIKFQPDLAREVGGTNLPWNAKQKDRTFAYGIGTEFYAIPNELTFVFQHDYLKSNGNVDYTLDPGLFLAGAGTGLIGIGANNENVDIMRSEDYTLYSFKFKTIYNFTKSLAASLGYAYERFRYSDVQLDDYNYTPSGVSSNSAFLTGAYKDQSYTANMIFGGLTYRF